MKSQKEQVVILLDTIEHLLVILDNLYPEAGVETANINNEIISIYKKIETYKKE